MFKYIVVLAVSLLTSFEAHCFLDFMGEASKDVAEAAGFADAAAELLDEIVPDTSVSEGSASIDERMSKLRRDVGGANRLASETRSVLGGPNWQDQRLAYNIRSTTHYLRRIKRLVAKLTALGTKGATALNTFQTNLNLQEVQRNQQARLLQEKEYFLVAQEEKERERASWRKFINKQRSLRAGRSGN